MKSLTASGFGISAFLFHGALAYSGLVWALSRAQYLAVENLQFVSSGSVQIVVKAEDTKLRVDHSPNLLCGIPFKLDDSVPDTTIELRLGDEIIYRIENLAVPVTTISQHEE